MASGKVGEAGSLTQDQCHNPVPRMDMNSKKTPRKRFTKNPFNILRHPKNITPEQDF
jgi:hypothetical protein